ncbi:helix-turn-helix domain-containing protein [Parabacteroides sp. PF5-9]|uniref:helix-turn-helix domain-containing protein n=1 Tax=Parabacteroides sp. PF5-9 TaxID=1742404 RepID=UPI0024755068|nr:helix-turn-helix domain-containing protein [Parabacteroides sp. PF5-9]MDH6357024.1 streptogramin lyase [Parabacteroides sp. PF5-9]
MKVVVIESEVYKKLVRKIEWIYSYTKKRENENATLQSNPSEVWLNDQDAAAILRVSKRTMQRLRSNGEITYSIRGGKAWYTLAEVKRLLLGRVIINRKEASHE